MTAATITPMRPGAVLEHDGVVQYYPSYAAAAAEAEARGLRRVTVLRFPETPVDPPPLKASPA